MDEDDEAPILRRIRPSGWVGAAGACMVTVPIVVLQGIKTVYDSFTKPTMPPKDRTAALPDPMPSLIRERLHVSPGVHLMCVSPGRQPGKPLMLMVHGFPEIWYSWRHQMAEFKQEYDVVAIDMRGYGESDKPPGVASYTLDKLITDLCAVVAGLGHRTCTLVGHDWGGIVCWLTAAMHPEMVDRLVVLAAPHLGLAQTNQSLEQAAKSWYMLYFQSPWLPERWLTHNDCRGIAGAFKYSDHGVVNKQSITDVDIEWFKQAVQRPGAATAAINYYRALLPHLTSAPIDNVWRAMRRRIRLPTLCLFGANDQALGPALMNNIEEVAEGIEYHLIPNCSHWVQQDCPTEVNRLMRAFLTRTQDAVRSPGLAKM